MRIIALVVVLAFAVFAVLCLTGTLISANSIDNRVAEINVTYPQVDRNLKSVPLALTTARIAGEIDKNTKTVGPSFTAVVDDVNGIQNSAQSILDKGGEINKTAKSINGAVKDINALAAPLGGVFATINSDVASINSSAHGINDSFVTILDRSRSIDDGARGINTRAERVRDLTGPIKDDLDFVKETAFPGILRNSRSIANTLNLRGIGVPKSLTDILRGLGLSSNKGLLGGTPGALTAPVTQAEAGLGLLGPSVGSRHDDRDRHHDDSPLGGVGGLLGGG